MRMRSSALFIAAAMPVLLSAQPKSPADDVFATFPVPPRGKESLFYIQRNKNANTIVYDARLGPDGTLMAKDPVTVNWIRYATGGKREPISMLENNVAYGVRHKRSENGVAWMRWAATSKYPFTVEVGPDGQAEARTMIGGVYARLERVEIQAKEESLWPAIQHVDIFGFEVGSGRAVHERFIP